jgi:D-alanyl-D-alanine carboxypeptidase
MNRLPLILAAMQVVACSDSEPASPVRAEALSERFQSELEALHAELNFPGATAAYVLPDGTSGTAATGLSDVERRLPMTARSRMLAASIGKTFVGAEVLALAQQGSLGLDDPVAKWLGTRSWYSRLPNGGQITIRHLLNHTAGLPDHVYDEAFAKAVAQRWQEPGNPFPPEALVEFILDKEPLNEPGEAFHYSDTGYILLGLVIEEAAGRSFYEEVEERFLGPLKLDQTTPSNRRELEGLAAGYTEPDGQLGSLGLPPKSTTAPGVMAWNPALEWTGGGFVSTSRDLALWAKALYEGKAMPGDYLGELFRSVQVVPGEASYGAGVGIYENTPLGPVYGHGGVIPGYTSSMRYYPDYRFAVAFQVNTDVDRDGFAEAVQNRLAMLVAESLKRSSQ